MQNSTQSSSDQEVEALRQLTTALLEGISDPALVFDRGWRLRRYNPAAAALFGLSEESVGAALQTIVQSEALAGFAQRGQALAEWQPVQTSDSEMRAFAPRLQPIQSADDTDEGSVLILRDISPLKRMNYNQNESIRLLCHDLRSPLTYMKSYAGMLEAEAAGPVNQVQAGYVQKILAGITQMTSQIENIQDAGRFDPETGFYEMQRAACDVGEIVVHIVQEYLLPADKQELKIAINVADDAPMINADAHMLKRAIHNLIDNAVKYTPNGGSIEVHVRTVNNSLQIAVRDTGLGISPENQKRLFQRHVRILRQEHKRIKGTGLGLFIIKSVARQHSGDAWVESVEGQGSTFIISIPLKGANLVQPQASD